MPNKDGTGPMGQGAMTGGGWGCCVGSAGATITGRWGCCVGSAGATITGRWGAMRQQRGTRCMGKGYGLHRRTCPLPNTTTEADLLKNQASLLQQEIDRINGRIAQIDASENKSDS